ncbi:MAG: cell division protein ZapC [Phenylobacterium sp.]|jgi:cell division protein ZapC
MLQPTEQWQWQPNPAHNQLFLDIDVSMSFTTAYESKYLTADAMTDNTFSLDDAEYYQQTVTVLSEMNVWSMPEVVQIALNATAAHRFYKPMMPKSWFFKTNRLPAQFVSSASASMSDAADAVCLLYTELGCGRFLVVEQGDKASICMLLEEQLPLNETRSMARFDIIKVMNDRQFTLCEVQQLKYA